MLKRVLRVIEYVGDDEFLATCVERRGIKGTFTTDALKKRGCYIREAVLGDTAEILSALPEEVSNDTR